MRALAETQYNHRFQMCIFPPPKFLIDFTHRGSKRGRMLGRVRTCSLSSLEVLEMERTPSKLLKDDSLSIYEKTLLKLQQGSQLNLTPMPEESTKTSTSSSISAVPSDEASMTVNAADCAPTGSFSSSVDSQSMIISKDESRGNLSVSYMFSRYKASRNDKKISCDDSAMEVEDYGSSAGISPSHDHELQEGCIVDPSSSVSSMNLNSF